MNISEKIFSLRKKLHDHNYRYYVLDDPLISDYDFDMMLKELEKPVEAMNHFRQAISLDPDNANAHYGLAQLLLAEGSVVEATDLLNTFSKLKEYEEKVLSSQSKAVALEKQLFSDVLKRVTIHSQKIRETIDVISSIDVLSTLSERAKVLGLSKPEIVENEGIEIRGGWHPVVKESTKSSFIANDVLLDKDTKMLVVTGPNMGGKSTFMRQTALITLLATIGSFVPAESARIGPIDQIFTRIGASDDLSKGQSTFMVEMMETAEILKNSTSKSLVLMDEIGRGTSTYDGIAIAWAAATHLAEINKANTLFATHYLELTELSKRISKIKNVHMKAMEYQNEIVFLYEVHKGPANQSYGVQVAKLAGVPDSVIESATERLNTLEIPNKNNTQADLFSPPKNEVEKPDALTEKLKKIDLDEISPREALSLLYELKKSN